MTEEQIVTANHKNIHAIVEVITNSLRDLKKIGVNWNLAEVAIAYFEIVKVLRVDMEKDVKEREKRPDKMYGG